MYIRKIYPSVLILVIIYTLFFMSSCSDPVKGCTDPDSETYDVKAEDSDPSLCVYARDKFIGEYEGSLICPDTLNLVFNFNPYNFSVTESLNGVSSVDVNITVKGLPTKLAGQVSGSILTINQTITDPAFLLPTGMTTAVTIKANGTATMTENNKKLSGSISLSVTIVANGAVIGTDTCPIQGTKK